MGSYSNCNRSGYNNGCGYYYNRSTRSGCGCNGCSNLTPFGIIRAVSRIGCCNRCGRNDCGCHDHDYEYTTVYRNANGCGCDNDTTEREVRYTRTRGTGCGCGCDD